MGLAASVLSGVLSLEFIFAPFNLWSGRTMSNFTRFTGLPERTATHVLAPIKLITAALLVTGVFVAAASVAGAMLTLAICTFYLVRLAHPSRRDPAGVAGFAIFGVLALALLVLRAVG